MIPSFAVVDKIVKTLPIGLYTSRRIELSLKKDIATSYYAPLEDSIVIAYKNIVDSVAKLQDNDKHLETSIRSIVYHEVSHALLTPQIIEPTDIINIFEDERIETILANFYYNINFKRNIIYLNNYHKQPPQNAMDEFYQVVRFRQGRYEDLLDVQEIISRYRTMTQNNYDKWRSYWTDRDSSVSISDYIDDIYKLYNKIAERWNEEHKQYHQDLYRQQGVSGSLLADNENSNLNSSETELTDDEIDNMISQMGGLEGQQDGTKQVEQLISDVLNQIYDQSLIDSFTIILNNFNKKTNNGGFITSYSGLFDPRRAGQEDYKYFIRKNNTRGSNVFGHFHLNLFLDDSGSMSSNEAIINKILYTLNVLEKRNPIFSYDIITCADNIAICDKTKTYLARGGTHLRNSIIPLYRQVQKPNAYNYNIVLFDGRAHVDKYLGHNTFSIFDNNNSTIISDHSNESHLRHMKTARIIYSNHYTDELLNNILKTLQGAFR